MKILRLTNSNDVLAGASTNRPSLIGSLLEDRYGEPIETVVKTPWPNGRMPEVVEAWVRREQPDVVFLSVVNYWYNYPSVPLRLRRLLGPLGDRLARLGFRAAENRIIGPSLPFRLGRKALLRTLGGDYHFEPEELVSVIEATARRILRNEGVILVVWGPHGRADWAETAGQRRRARHRQEQVVAGLTRLCADLHVAYHASARPAHLDHGDPEFAADHFHFAPIYGEQSAREQAAFLIDAIEAAGYLPGRP